MIVKLLRMAGLLGVLLAFASPNAPGATPKEIDNALKGGTGFLKARYARGGNVVEDPANHGIGGTCLAGIALLEAGTPITDAAIKNITDLVRDAAYKETSTYRVSLCLMYLDRCGDPVDVPLIQMLGIRLLAFQSVTGGWTYSAGNPLPKADEDRIRAAFKQYQPNAEDAKQPLKLHPEVEKFTQWLAANRIQPTTDDNSNTQFAVLAVWLARKHGVPVESALDLVEKRYIASQDHRTGNWPYSGLSLDNSGKGIVPGSNSMYCAGLLGMSTSLARREERRTKTATLTSPKKETTAKQDKKSDDPFYNPPAGKDLPKTPQPALAADARDIVVQRAVAGLGLTVADQIRRGQGLLLAKSAGHGNGDLYFLWSLERVGVIYGIDKIGGFDWYDIGSTNLVRSQGNDGSWGKEGYGTEVNASFAVLFLCRSNLARDLSNRVQKDTSTEMRAGTVPAATNLQPNRPTTNTIPVVDLPNPTDDAGIALASKMLKSNSSDWAKLLAETRDAKGATNTRALLVTATNADGDRKLAAREALAERLCRMTPTTLRTMLKSEEAELRRAATLACAMKDDKSHIPDLIGMLTDESGSVVRAAIAGLKSLTGKEFATASEWREWYDKEKK